MLQRQAIFNFNVRNQNGAEAITVANMHTIDGSQEHSSIPPGNMGNNFRAVAVRNVTTSCAATPALPWVAMGDTNMPLHEFRKLIEAPTSRWTRKPDFVVSPARKRDFIWTDARVKVVKDKSFLAWDNEHWAVAATVFPRRETDLDSELSDEAVSAATRDSLAMALKSDAQAAAEQHINEQQAISDKSIAAEEDEHRAVEMLEQQADASMDLASFSDYCHSS